MNSVLTESNVAGVEAIADPDRLIPEFLEWLRESTAETTVKTYRSALQDFVRRMQIRDLRDVDDALIDRYRGCLFLGGLVVSGLIRRRTSRR